MGGLGTWCRGGDWARGEKRWSVRGLWAAMGKEMSSKWLESMESRFKRTIHAYTSWRGEVAAKTTRLIGVCCSKVASRKVRRRDFP